MRLGVGDGITLANLGTATPGAQGAQSPARDVSSHRGPSTREPPSAPYPGGRDGAAAASTLVSPGRPASPRSGPTSFLLAPPGLPPLSAGRPLGASPGGGGPGYRHGGRRGEEETWGRWEGPRKAPGRGVGGAPEQRCRRFPAAPRFSLWGPSRGRSQAAHPEARRTPCPIPGAAQCVCTPRSGGGAAPARVCGAGFRDSGAGRCPAHPPRPRPACGGWPSGAL